MYEDKRKIDELYKRIKQLEIRCKNFSVNHFEIKKEGVGNANEHTFNFKINVLCDCFLQLCVKIKTQCAIYNLQTKINNVPAFNCSLSGNGEINRGVWLAAGINTVSVVVSSSDLFEIEECTLLTNGAIEYVESPVILSVINEPSRSIILFSYDGETLIKRYIGGLLQNVVALKCEASAICKLGQKYALFYIDNFKTLKLSIYDGDFTLENQITLDTCVCSVCAVSGSACKAFAVKGNRVYSYSVDSLLNVVATATEYNAKSVKSNPDVSEYIIITDFSGSDKLVSV